MLLKDNEERSIIYHTISLIQYISQNEISPNVQKEKVGVGLKGDMQTRHQIDYFFNRHRFPFVILVTHFVPMLKGGG
jgi:hypothetical protein